MHHLKCYSVELNSLANQSTVRKVQVCVLKLLVIARSQDAKFSYKHRYVYMVILRGPEKSKQSSNNGKILVSNLLVVLLSVPSLLVVSCVISQECQDEHTYNNLIHFTEAGLIPYFVPCKPKDTATIYYNADDYVLVGNVLTVAQVRNEPTINFPSFQRRTNYTVLMVDVDAPSREDPKLSPYLHFLAVNSYEVIMGTSDKVVPYQSPSPPPGTGYHNYVWLLFKQNGYINPNKLMPLASHRENFSIKQFMDENRFTVPKAGNIFRSRA